MSQGIKNSVKKSVSLMATTVAAIGATLLGRRRMAEKKEEIEKMRAPRREVLTGWSTAYKRLEPFEKTPTPDASREAPRIVIVDEVNAFDPAASTATAELVNRFERSRETPLQRLEREKLVHEAARLNALRDRPPYPRPAHPRKGKSRAVEPADFFSEIERATREVCRSLAVPARLISGERRGVGGGPGPQLGKRAMRRRRHAEVRRG